MKIALPLSTVKRKLTLADRRRRQNEVEQFRIRYKKYVTAANACEYGESSRAAVWRNLKLNLRRAPRYTPSTQYAFFTTFI